MEEVNDHRTDVVSALIRVRRACVSRKNEGIAAVIAPVIRSVGSASTSERSSVQKLTL